ncbi:MAG: CHASE2 domain-containing protein [Symploca sp. SIO2E6]|nr:CHASE2 domain-containing protein [Symploca sp. SIO2E6]
MISHLSEKIRLLLSNPNDLGKSVTAFGGTVLLASALITGATAILQQLGVLEGLELAAYDQLVRSRPDEGLDERLLVVAINDADIQQQNQFPIHDNTLTEVLAKLEEYQPRAIGIDILRDVPIGEGRAGLTNLLKQNDNIIAVCKLSSEDEPGNPAAPGVPEERVGFADLPLDPDTSIRRSILVSTPTPPKTPIEKPHLCNYDDPENQIDSLALQLAVLYLAEEGIEPEPTEYGELKLGPTVFRPLEDNAGGYYSAGAVDYQLMLNYRSAENAAKQVSITEVLEGKVEPNLVKNRVVLIGYTTTTANDDFTTPYSAAGQDRVEMPGVVIHAQSVSQILSAVLDNRPLIWYWPQWGEILWLFGWSVVGGSIAWSIHRPWLFALAGGSAIALLYGNSYLLFLQAGWIPLVPPAIALVATAGGVVIIDRYGQTISKSVKTFLRLNIEIDQEQKEEQVAEITETEYFQNLQQKAQQLREQKDNSTTNNPVSSSPSETEEPESEPTDTDDYFGNLGQKGKRFRKKDEESN